MNHLARYAWVAVLGTALMLSWWSLDTLARRYGMPTVLAGMVSATFDGAALVAADLAMRRAMKADSGSVVKLFMLSMVGLSAWLNFEHGLLLDYPLAIRVLFASPSVVSGCLFELQLRQLHRARLHELDLVAPSLPRFGLLVWLFHPWAALRHVSQIASSRLQSVPVTITDWRGAPVLVQQIAALSEPPVALADPTEAADEAAGQGEISESADECIQEDAPRTLPRAGRSPVPDELYVGKLRVVVEEKGGAMPSAREVARRLGIGQDRARRLIAVLKNERQEDAELERASG